MNLAATREALDRFVAELPAGLHADRLRRTADATRALIEQALTEPGAPSTWADHNLAVVVADGLGHPGTATAARTLFLGVRRRLADAIAHDPDDLAAALALGLGAVLALDDARTASDIEAVAAALARPQVGPRLVAAAVELVVSAANADDDAVKAAALAAAGPVRGVAERVAARLPDHPGAALDRIRLALLGARAVDGDARASTLATVRGLLRDHEARFGETAAAREILAGVLGLEARGATPSADIRRDALALLEADVRGHAAGSKRTTKLLRTLQRAGQLDATTAGHITELLGSNIDRDDPRWFEARALLHEATGDAAALLTLWQHTIEADPQSRHAARGLVERLLDNLRRGLPVPFESPILDRVLDALAPAAAARWSADDVDRLLDLVTTTFGGKRSFTFANEKLLAARELRGKDGLWLRVLALANELGEADDAVIEVARGAIKQRNLPEARLALARALIARREHLDEADEALRPLYEKKGPHAAAAQALKGRMKDDPAFRRSRYDTLLAFEHKLGVGTGKSFPLAVVFTTRSYALVELTDQPAPEGYEHKHLRTMVRAEDLPDGVTPLDLQKGDILYAPLRGQDADPSRDKEGLRVYWIADKSQLRLALDAAVVTDRWSKEEAAFGINGDTPVPIKVAWDKKKGKLVTRLLKAGGDEFRVRPALDPERLPGGLDPEKVGGRGRRFWGLVARTDDGSRPGQRTYAVVSDLTLVGPDGRADDDGAGADEPNEAGAATPATPDAAAPAAPVAATSLAQAAAAFKAAAAAAASEGTDDSAADADAATDTEAVPS